MFLFFLDLSDWSDGSDWWDGSDGLGEGGFGVFGVDVEVGDVVGNGFGEAVAVLGGPVDAVVVAYLFVAVVEAAEDVAVFPRFLDVGAEPFVGDQCLHDG